ncbi:MAG: transposase [Armatimonadetes bacterium]|nr:transposase [Armatimonadota bacterium]
MEAKTGRKARVSRRQIVNTILYVARTGCQWRNWPHDMPNWSTVFSCYRRWAWNGTLNRCTRRCALRCTAFTAKGF